jgi:para-nitrobenzyl esterase
MSGKNQPAFSPGILVGPASTLLAGFMLASSALYAANFPQIVQVDTGSVKGVLNEQSAVNSFKGIPFAAPPVGNLRWKAPMAAAKWAGVLNTDHFGNSCMQVVRHGASGGRAFSSESRVPNSTSEDCLYLNVWTPAKSAGDKLPVMVWIYGGGFQVGSGAVPIYDGEGLASKGVVVVSFNYRLGIFGFLAHQDLDKESAHAVSGNYGTLDQIAALQWVARNIASFGGDPKCVTIFGQSAGGGSVQFLTLSPLAKGLFQRAISENGTLFPDDPFLQERSPSAYKTLKQAESDDAAYLHKAGAESLQELRSMTTAQIDALPLAPFPPAFFCPTIDGWVLPEGFAETYAHGKQIDVPFMVGWTSSYYPQLKITVAQLHKWAEQRYGALASEFLALYPASTDEEAAQAVEQAARDSYRTSIFLWAQSRQKSFKTYLYYFNHPLPGPDAAARGATAGSEIPYVLNSLSRSGRPFVKEDYALADTMTAYWSNFASSGNPNGKGLPEWPAFSPGAKVVMQLGNDDGPIPAATDARFEFFKRYFASKPPLCGFAQGCSIDMQ